MMHVTGRQHSFTPLPRAKQLRQTLDRENRHTCQGAMETGGSAEPECGRAQRQERQDGRKSGAHERNDRRGRLKDCRRNKLIEVLGRVDVDRRSSTYGWAGSCIAGRVADRAVGAIHRRSAIVVTPIVGQHAPRQMIFGWR